MPVTPIDLLTNAGRANAAAQLQATTNATAAAAPAANQATLATFSAVLGQVLAQLGPLAFDTGLTTIGNGNNANAGAGANGLTNTVFDLFLLNSLGLGQVSTQPAVQQLLTAQLLFGETGATDTLGLNVVVEQQIAAALAQQQGAGATLLAQTNAASTQPNPIVFSAGVLAQAFQIGNGTGSPA